MQIPILETGDEIQVLWRHQYWYAEYRDTYSDESILVTMLETYVPGIREEDDLVCEWDGLRWVGVFTVQH